MKLIALVVFHLTRRAAESVACPSPFDFALPIEGSSFVNMHAYQGLR